LFVLYCGSLYHTKQGFREINPKLDDGEKIKISLQRYKCKSCGKKYSTGLGNLKKRIKTFLKLYRIKLPNQKNRGGSLRKISKDVSNILKSHHISSIC
jgi:transposase-like protein